MFFISHISGNSMYPTLIDNEMYLCKYVTEIEIRNLSVYDIVILKLINKSLIKRITYIFDSFIYASGDNRDKSYDSKDFGYVDKRFIYGLVISRIYW